jgi:hypothetical protein
VEGQLESLVVRNRFDSQVPFQSARSLRSASNLVGLMIIARTSPRLTSDGGIFLNRSRRGIRNASVFPDPVTASTTTSLFLRNRGIVLACTGVISVNPINDTHSSLHSSELWIQWNYIHGDIGGSTSLHFVDILYPCRESSKKGSAKNFHRNLI